MVTNVLPLLPSVCKQCRKPYVDPRSEFCSIQCRIAWNDAADAVLRPSRPRCAVEGCSNPVRTKKAVYCRDCRPKVSLRPKVQTIPPVPPGEYRCHWCPKMLKAEMVVLNRVNEDYHDNRPENTHIVCERCHKEKQRALFFLAGIGNEQFNEFGQIVINYRNRHN